MKYSLRPTLVEAEQYVGEAKSPFLLKALQTCSCEGAARCSMCGAFYVNTPFGTHVVEEGDYVIKRGDGYLVMKADKFAETYKKEH